MPGAFCMSWCMYCVSPGAPYLGSHICRVVNQPSKHVLFFISCFCQTKMVIAIGCLNIITCLQGLYDDSFMFRQIKGGCQVETRGCKRLQASCRRTYLLNPSYRGAPVRCGEVIKRSLHVSQHGSNLSSKY